MEVFGLILKKNDCLEKCFIFLMINIIVFFHIFPYLRLVLYDVLFIPLLIVEVLKPRSCKSLNSLNVTA